MHATILLPVSGQSYQLELEKPINYLSFLTLACLNRLDTGASFISA